MNQRAIWTIVRKDLKIVARSRNTLLTLVSLPLIIFVVLPVIMVLITRSADAEAIADQFKDFGGFLENMPDPLRTEFEGLTPQQEGIVLLSTYFVAPLYLVVPMMLASVLAADSFAGERERKTLEGLLYTPVTETELFAGKMLVALIPAMLVSLGGLIVYSLVVNTLAYPVMGRVFFPNFMWILLAVWVGPAVAGLGLGATVIVSSKVKTIQEAYQIGGFIVIPIVLLVAGQAAGVIYFSVGLVLALGFVLWLVDLGLLWLGIKTFRRGEIIARL